MMTTATRTKAQWEIDLAAEMAATPKCYLILNRKGFQLRVEWALNETEALTKARLSDPMLPADCTALQSF